MRNLNFQNFKEWLHCKKINSWNSSDVELMLKFVYKSTKFWQNFQILFETEY